VLRFLQQEPALALMKIERLQPEAGIRETYRIVGETVVTEADYEGGRVFADAVAHSFYPIDLHFEGGVKPKHLPEGVVPTVPRGALIPKGSRNLLVAGRCVSSDRLANSALRVQASCMGMGQAAGANAALAAQAGVSPAGAAGGAAPRTGPPRRDRAPRARPVSPALCACAHPFAGQPKGTVAAVDRPCPKTI
jgi:hypothetical protein